MQQQPMAYVLLAGSGSCMARAAVVAFLQDKGGLKRAYSYQENHLFQCDPSRRDQTSG